MVDSTLTIELLSELEELCNNAVSSSVKPRLGASTASLMLTVIKEARASRRGIEWSTVLRSRTDRIELFREAEDTLEDCRDAVENWQSGSCDIPDGMQDPANWECVIQWQIIGEGEWHDHE